MWKDRCFSSLSLTELKTVWSFLLLAPCSECYSAFISFLTINNFLVLLILYLGVIALCTVIRKREGLWCVCVCVLKCKWYYILNIYSKIEIIC